ncbi:hypothetical protein AA14337_3282 [Acetobacter malorum DSM 14337]|uniref:NYN domain-containing protein n=1 Tax=Acetobacter malorum DSM 14337 TaxID=1307910 RepID=A0ABQ0Q0R2_9PROT|nr:NYN domain-containing protein [Acetobacter malorum]GBQ86287.1 hypothetical protein AA14337_3282 [Acetobacter malorum DSM 14337]
MAPRSSRNSIQDYLVSGEKLAVFIDGQSLYQSSRALAFEIDYSKVLAEFEKASLLRAYYFVAMLETEDYSPLKPLTDWLSYNGYSVVTKPAREYNDGNGHRRVKGSVAVEIAVEMMEMAPHVDHIILFSGDSELKHAVEAVKRRGTKITAFSTMHAGPQSISDDLRRSVDGFVELSQVMRPIQRRPPPASQRVPEDNFQDPEIDSPTPQFSATSGSNKPLSPIRMGD